MSACAPVLCLETCQNFQCKPSFSGCYNLICSLLLLHENCTAILYPWIKSIYANFFFLSPYLLPPNILFLSFQNYYHSNWLQIGILCLLAELLTSGPSGISLYWLHNDPFKYVCILIPRICKCVTLYGKKDFASVTKLKELEMGRVSWIAQVGPT